MPKGHKKDQEKNMQAARGILGHAPATRANQVRIPTPAQRQLATPVPTELAGHTRTEIMAKKWLTMLQEKSAGTGYTYNMSRSVTGSFRFEARHHGKYHGTYSFPTLSSVFDEQGAYTGHMAGIKMARLPSSGGGGVESAYSYISRHFVPGMRSSDLNTVVSTAMGRSRWAPVAKPGRAMTPIPGMHQHQYRVDLADGTRIAESPYDVPTPGVMLNRFFTARSRARKQLGIGLHLDVAKETSLALQQYAEYRASDISVFGGLYKGGYKMMQQHRTLPISVTPSMLRRVADRPFMTGGIPFAGGATARDLMFHGRMFETGYIKDMAGIDPRTGMATGAIRQPNLLNTTQRLFLGQTGVHMLPDKDSAIHAIEFQRILGMGTRRNLPAGTTYRGNLTGTAYHGFMTKTNVAGFASAGELRAGVVRSMRRSDPALVMEAMLGAVQQGMIEKGRTAAEIGTAMRAAFGESNLRPGRGVVTKGYAGGKFTSGGRLFDIDLPENWMSLSARKQAALTRGWASQQHGAMRDVVQRALSASGLSLSELENMGIIERNQQGMIESIVSFGGIAQREQDLYRWGESVGAGLNPQRGLRISTDTVVQLRNRGAGLMADYMSDALRDPAITRHLKFGTEAKAVLSHLTTSGAAYGGGPGISMDDLLGGKRGELVEFFKNLQADIKSREVYSTAGAAEALHGFAKKHKLGKLAALFSPKTAGFMVDLGAPREIATQVTVKGQSQFASGTLSTLPLGFIGDDDRAFQLARFLAKGPSNANELNRMVRSSIEHFSGGHGSFYGKLFRPKLGQAIAGRIQNPFSTGAAGANDLFDDMVKRHLAAYGGKFESSASYVAMSANKLRSLDPALRALHEKQGYIPGFMMRQPETGRAAVGARFIFTKDKSVRGKLAMVMKQGVSSWMGGDTDADDLMAVLASGEDKKLTAAIMELERVQAPGIARQQIIRSNLELKNALDTQKDITALIDSTMGSKQATKEILRLMEKATPGKQLEGILAAQSTKVSTPMVDPLVKFMGASWAAARSSKVISTTAAQEALMTDFIPAMIETAISKHKGTDTLSLVQGLNQSLLDNAAAIAGGNINNGIRGRMRDILSNSIIGFQGEKGAGAFAEALAGYGPSGQALAGKFMDLSVTTGDVNAFLAGGGSDMVDNLIRASARGLVAKSVLDEFALPNKKIFNLGHVQSLQTPFGKIPTADPMVKELAALQGYDIVTGIEFKPAGAAQAALSSQAAAAPMKAAAVPFKQRAKGLYGELVDWAFNTAKQNKGKTAGGALILGGVAALAGLNAISNVVGRSDHIANQPDPISMIPQTQYVMNPYDTVGYDLSMTGSAGPEALLFSRGIANQMSGGADVRLMDSRISLSDTALGRMADDKMDSVYARSFI